MVMKELQTLNSAVQILELERKLLLQITSTNRAGSSQAQDKPIWDCQLPVRFVA